MRPERGENIGEGIPVVLPGMPREVAGTRMETGKIGWHGKDLLPWPELVEGLPETDTQIV
jgi:hypothetical protein